MSKKNLATVEARIEALNLHLPDEVRDRFTLFLNGITDAVNELTLRVQTQPQNMPTHIKQQKTLQNLLLSELLYLEKLYKPVQH